MGKISEYLIELAEMYEDWLNMAGNVGDAQREIKKILDDDEYQFFMDHLDVIEEMLDFTDGIEGPDSIEEASGLKGDVLRPWGGRRARAKMGYGRGNRAGFDPKEEIDTPEEIERDDIIMQDIDDDNGAPLTSEIIDGEEVFDVGQSEDDWIYDTPETHAQRMKARKEMLSKPYPMGSGGVDNVFDDEGNRIEESYIMPPLNEYDEDDEDMWVTINGKRVHKDSREYKKWYEEEGEFDDVEGREYRNRNYRR